MCNMKTVQYTKTRVASSTRPCLHTQLRSLTSGFGRALSVRFLIE